MTTKHAATLFPLFVAMVALGVIRGTKDGAWGEPMTYVGIGCGLAIAAAAWLYGRRREQR